MPDSFEQQLFVALQPFPQFFFICISMICDSFWVFSSTEQQRDNIMPQRRYISGVVTTKSNI
jgi:hypothetical protein